MLWFRLPANTRPTSWLIAGIGFTPVCQKFDHVPLFQPFLPFTAFQAVTSSPAVSRPLRDPPNATSNVMVARLCLHCQWYYAFLCKFFNLAEEKIKPVVSYKPRSGKKLNRTQAHTFSATLCAETLGFADFFFCSNLVIVIAICKCACRFHRWFVI
jgi:hypothetical protein